MKKFLAGILIALMLLTVLVSCNKDDNVVEESGNDTKNSSDSVTDESKNSSDTSDSEDEDENSEETEQTVETVDTVAGKTPLQAYKQAFEKIKAMTAYDIEIFTEYTYSYQGTTDDTSGTTELYRTDGTNAYYNSLESGEYWYIGNTMYSNTDGEKEKRVVNTEDYKLNYAINGADVIVEIKDSSFEGERFEKQDGIYYVSVEATPDAFSAFLGMTATRNAVCNMGFDKDGNIVSFSVRAVYDASAGMAIDITKSITFKKIGNVAAITAPSDADSYQTVS